MTSLPGLDDARLLITAADGLLAQALARARAITAHGADIDAHQVLAERVAYAATEGRAARAFVEFTAEAGREGRGSALLETTCAAAVALLVRSLRERIDGVRAVAIGCRSTSSRSRCAPPCANSPSARSPRKRSASTAETSWCPRPSSRRWPSSATSDWRFPRPTAAPSSEISP